MDKKFIEFAVHFSKSVDSLHNGHYFSDDKKYQIVLLDKYSSTTLPTVTRVSHWDGKIQVRRDLFLKQSMPLRIFSLLWCREKIKFDKDGVVKVMGDITADTRAIDILRELDIPEFNKQKFVHEFIDSLQRFQWNLERTWMFEKYVLNKEK